MLICRQLEFSLVDVGDISRPGLQVLLRFVLDVTVPDDSSVVVSAILPDGSTELVDLAGEVEQTCRSEFGPPGRCSQETRRLEGSACLS